MRIAIDISKLNTNHAARGIGIYVKQLIDALQTYETAHEYVVIGSKAKIPSSTDVVHYPFFDPFFLTLPLTKPFPTVVTVHDLIPLVFPEHFPSGLRGAMKWQVQKLSLQGASQIITDSIASKKDIQRIVGCAENSIHPIYLAPPLTPRAVTAKGTFEAVRRKYGLTESFLLYVGDINWNKNIPGLIKASAAFSLPLVLVGKAFLDLSLEETREIDRLVSTLGREKFVIRPGFVPDEDLVFLYESATCLVQPSHYEGFGLPVLEAFTSGCPVVVADNSSLSEIAGPGIRVNSNSVESITKGIQTVLALSKEKRSQLVEKGHEWVRQFSWKKVAHETVGVYERSIK
jgi:glycosyltransferase involved in cell wall biosynthesis